MAADGTGPFPVKSQFFGQKGAFCLADGLEPHGVIVVLADIGHLDVAHHLAVVHHGEAAGPAVIVHSRLGDALGAAHDGLGGLAVFVYFFVLGVAERVAVLDHEIELFLQFFGGPEVVAVEEGDPLAAGFAEGPVAADGCPAIMDVLEESDFGGIGGRDVLDDFGGVVGAGVVHDNQFPVGICLGHHRSDRFCNIFAGIVTRHDYGDKAVHYSVKM